MISCAIDEAITTPTGTQTAQIPRCNISLAPSRVNGVPASSSFVKYRTALLVRRIAPMQQISPTMTSRYIEPMLISSLCSINPWIVTPPIFSTFVAPAASEAMPAAHPIAPMMEHTKPILLITFPILASVCNMFNVLSMFIV